MPISISGIVSGLDTDNIVSGLLDIQQQQLDRMALRRTEIQQKQAAFKTIETRLLSLRADTGVLSRNVNNPLTRLAVSASDPDAVSATATTSAVPGVYRLTVDSTAQAHQVATQGFADADAEITTGTFEIRQGSGVSKSITIDSNNNSLSGLAAAINASGAGVSASIVQDSSGGASPWRLLLSSTKTGVASEITVTNNLAATAGTAIKPTLDFQNPVQAAADARVTLGSGAGAISVTSSTNQFKDVIAGVSFDLLQVESGETVSLTVSKDNTAAVNAVESFVQSFNGVLQFIDDNSKYNTATSEAGLFLGNQSASRIAQTLRSTVQNVIPGVNPLANRLSAAGITFNDAGRLVLDKTKLQNVLNGNVEGVDAEDVKRLFAFGGESTNSGISFVLGSTRTKTPANGVGVDISQAAEQATITAGTTLGASTVIDASNRTLELTLDGKTATVSLTEGTYTAQELANHVESVINESTDLPAREIKVGLESGALRMTSASYGSSSGITIVGGTAVGALGLAAGQSDSGRDVVGVFVVDGKNESAVGRGRVLTGDPDNENTADLQVSVTLAPGQVVAGAEGTLSVSRGLASALDQVLSQMLNTETGVLSSVDDGFDRQIDSIEKSIDRQTTLFDLQAASIREQFQALETAISQMNATSSYLGGQLASLPQINEQR